MRRSTAIWTVLGIAVVIGLFVVKHRVQELEEKLAALNSEIIADKESIQVLEAEWSYLNQPARLEALSTRLLGMEPPVADQMVSLQKFLAAGENADTGGPGTEVRHKPDRRPAPAAPEGDWLTPILAKLKKAQ